MRLLSSLISLAIIAALLVGCASPTSRCRGAAPATTPATEGTPMHEHHAIDYVEISVLSVEAAKSFYAAAFGWQFNDYGPNYAGIKKAHGEAGGLRQVEKVETGGPLVILYSADLDATLERVRAAGAEILQEPFDFPGGRRFHFRDPSGNELAVWGEK